MPLIMRKPALCIPGALKRGALWHAHPYYAIYRIGTVTAWIMPTLCLFFIVPCRVGMQSVIVAFIGRTLSF